MSEVVSDALARALRLLDQYPIEDDEDGHIRAALRAASVEVEKGRRQAEIDALRASRQQRTTTSTPPHSRRKYDWQLAYNLYLGGIRKAELARLYGVSRSAIDAMIRDVSRKHREQGLVITAQHERPVKRVLLIAHAIRSQLGGDIEDRARSEPLSDWHAWEHWSPEGFQGFSWSRDRTPRVPPPSLPSSGEAR